MVFQEPGKTAYMGCIGDDEFGKKLTDACKKVPEIGGAERLQLVSK